MIRLQRSKIKGLLTAKPSVQDVCAALQSAIELEHSTIPLYLYAQYSLDANKNPGIVAIIDSVVIEEMLHMTLSSNVLNALGGSPQIDRPDFIPKFPGPLPGGVESELTVDLAPFSMKQLQTFLQIEQPEEPINIRSAATLASAAGGEITIGEFYTAISSAIAALGDSAFVKPARNQVGPDLMDGAVVVVDVASAQKAIATIIVQGEGTATSPDDGDADELAHYYRFMQIQKGHLLVPAPGKTPPWAYVGTAVPFDTTGVYAVPTNPAVSGYPAGSSQAFANDNFNYTYTSLLGALHVLFNGRADDDQMNRSIGLMMSLKGQAKAMAAGLPSPTPAVFTGASFEYQPVNPPTR